MRLIEQAAVKSFLPQISPKTSDAFVSAFVMLKLIDLYKLATSFGTSSLGSFYEVVANMKRANPQNQRAKVVPTWHQQCWMDSNFSPRDDCGASALVHQWNEVEHNMAGGGGGADIGLKDIDPFQVFQHMVEEEQVE